MINFNQLFIWAARALVLVTAMPVHECAHGFVAHLLGDDTAEKQGRLTLNPFAHLDLVGSLLILLAGFGWAKPVPVNPNHFKKPKWGMALTALAGPLSNILMALVAMIVFKLLYGVFPLYREGQAVDIALNIIGVMISVNLALAVFNLLPMPPLDGAKIFGALLPDKVYFKVMQHERRISLIVFAVVLLTDWLNWPIAYVSDRLLALLNWLTLPLGSIY